MVKSLVDACLLKIEENISYFNRLGRELSRKHKEILIERLCWHRRLTPHNVSTVAQHLFVPALLRLNFSHSDQVDDKLLEEVAECGCYPEYITIRNCPKVTGKSPRCNSPNAKVERCGLLQLPLSNCRLPFFSSPIHTKSYRLRSCDPATSGIYKIRLSCIL